MVEEKEGRAGREGGRGGEREMYIDGGENGEGEGGEEGD